MPILSVLLARRASEGRTHENPLLARRANKANKTLAPSASSYRKEACGDMAALNPPKAGPVREEPDAIRLVLFGMPEAGKSSLLGALAQAAHSQTRTLHGHLSDLSSGLTELRRQLYDADGSDSPHEITPYPVRFIPFGKENSIGYQAILYDCDGNAVNQMLVKQKKLDATGSPLVDAIRQADALILLIDASATYDQLADDFREFVRFLKTLEGHRTHHHAVGGWPIFLVLTKCDLLAREPISRSMWHARIEAREKEVAAQFKDFFEEEDELPAEYLAFGSLDVQVRSVGVSRPKLTDAEAQAREPFGVAELFHDAINTGLTYKHRSQKSGQRLAWTVFGAGGLLATMATVAGLLLTAPPAPEPQLALSSKVEMVQSNEGSTAVARLAGTAIDRRLRELMELKNHPDFEKLPEAQKNYITNRITEAQTYIKFRDELFAIPGPGKARTLDELTQVEQRLTKLSVPVAYQGEWQQTEIVQLRERMLVQEIPALKDAVGKLTTYYQLLNNRARTFSTTELTPEWETRVTGLLDEAEKGRPFTKSDPLHGSAYKFDDVALAEGEWQKLLTRLTGLRDIATALGLLGDGTKAPLALSDPPANADIAALATKRMQLLKTTFPEYTSWKISNVPEAVQPDIVRRLKRSKEQCERDGQRLLHAKLRDLNPGSTELAADWPRVADYLADASLQDYRSLLGLLTKLYDPSAEDPAQAAIAFLKRPAFDLEVKTLRLTIPDGNFVEPVSDSDLVFVYRGNGDTVRLNFRQTAKERVGQAVTYTFTARGESKLTYKPGDTFFAELPLKGTRDMKEMKFTWSSSRTSSFQFERLFREPQLHDAKKSNVDGLPATGVVVTIDKFPMVPAIVPLVQFDKR